MKRFTGLFSMQITKEGGSVLKDVDKYGGSNNDVVRPDHRRHKKGLVLVTVNVVAAAIILVRKMELRKNTEDLRKY